MILLTGASGFIGKHILKKLIEKVGKDNVVAFTSTPINDCKYVLHNNYKFNDDFFENSEFTNIKSVIHAGAFTPKSGSESNKVSESFTNINSTLKLIEALPISVENFIFLSTLDVYSISNEKIAEESQVNPVSLYGLSKLYCERMLESWAKEKNKQLSILRIGHVYGPGEEMYKKIIPVTMNRLLDNMSPQIWGEGNELRSFIYIDDVVKMIIKSLEVIKYEGPINIVSQTAASIKEIVETIIEISGVDISPDYIESNAKPRDLVFDNTKMKKILDVETFNLKNGLMNEWSYMKKIHAK